ncbi:hypothetical protein BBP40_011986 [Aspergillus hancockii]|nr:hypothetical protein BBP40_011986 [Aspergillus hancockii]
MTRAIDGHEGVGDIVKLGPGREGCSKKPGDRIGIKYIHSACRTCVPCLLGAESCCTRIKVSGSYTPGTFQEYCLAPADYVTPIPVDVAFASRGSFIVRRVIGLQCFEESAFITWGLGGWFLGRTGWRGAFGLSDCFKGDWASGLDLA